MALRVGRRTIPSIACTVALTLLVALGLLWHVAGRQDTEAMLLARRLLGTALGQPQVELRRTLGDYAGWGDAYRHLHASVDASWAYDEANIGRSVYGTLGYELVVVLDASDRAVYAMDRGELAEVDLRRRFGPGLSTLLRQARQVQPGETAPVAGLLMVDGMPAIVGVAALSPGNDPTVDLVAGPPSLLVFADLLDPPQLDAIGAAHFVDGVRVAAPGDPAADAMLPLVDPAGTTVAALAWKPTTPGQDMLRAVLPWLGVLLAAVVTLTVLVLRHAWGAARLVEAGGRALQASEARLRDIVDASSDWVWETDSELRFTYLSERFGQVTGHAPEALLGSHHHHFLRPHGSSDQAWNARWADPAARRSCRDLLCRYLDRDGGTRYGRLAAKPVLAADGSFLGYRGTASDVTAEVEAQAELQRVSSHDVLTGLPNRALLNDRLRELLAQMRGGTQAAVLGLDLDRFKAVNDTLGHATGDALLREVAARFGACVRHGDMVARLGGDEFVVLQTQVAGPGDTEALCRRLMDCLAEPIVIDGQELCIGLSIGVATAPADGDDPATLLRHADIALYQAKADGRGAFRQFVPQMSDRLQSRRALELDLRRALAQDELALHFQSRFETAGLRPTGVEALLRWSRRGSGLVGPEGFVPLAEETGLIVPIGAWVLREACRQIVALPGLAVSVNLSPVQFRRGDLVATVEAALAEHDLDPRRLELELTEGVLLESSASALRLLHGLKRLGIRLALDDFGTGYSSLSYLQSFPFDRVKIDRRFVSRLGKNAEAGAIVRAVIDLARGLGMATTAEGVETHEQLALLRAAGCDEVQGFLLGRPAPLGQLQATGALGTAAPGIVRLVAADRRR